jgi:uncharacterized oligopeptide transporter (OPT) family protein
MNALDKIFWKRFADEYKLDPNNPGPACVAGMLQVGVIVFIALTAIFRPAARLVTLALAAAGADAIARIWNPIEFRATLFLGAIVSFYFVRHRYWAYRLQPERSGRFGDELNRGAIVLLVAGLLSASGALMFLTFWLVRNDLAF